MTAQRLGLIQEQRDGFGTTRSEALKPRHCVRVESDGIGYECPGLTGTPAVLNPTQRSPELMGGCMDIRWGSSPARVPFEPGRLRASGDQAFRQRRISRADSNEQCAYGTTQAARFEGHAFQIDPWR
jgi:hypothetical protein